MKTGDLTTLANVLGWLTTTNYNAPGNISPVIQGLITRWSSSILAYLERPSILPFQFLNDAYDGDGGTHQFLRNWPVTSVTQVAVSGRIVPYVPIYPGQVGAPSFPYGYGYRFEEWDSNPPGGPQAIELIGSRFHPGKLNVQITYNAGYLVSEEPWQIPAAVGMAPPTIVVDQPKGIWASDVGVVYVNTGLPLTPTQTNPPTTPGTYYVQPPDTVISAGDYSPPGVYFFAPGDIGQAVLISYGFIPAALEQVAIEMICERFLYRGRIGEISRTVGTQMTAKYDMSDVPAYVRPTLQRYKSILPL